MPDIRKGDVLEFAGGVVEVQQVTANGESGLDMLLHWVEKKEDLSINVMRAGGPLEREDDKDNRPEEIHLERAESEDLDEDPDYEDDYDEPEELEEEDDEEEDDKE